MEEKGERCEGREVGEKENLTKNKNKIKGVFGKQTFKLRTAHQFING